MQPLKARVQRGRLVLDEPTDLPEGEVVYLHPVEPVAGPDDGFTVEERARLFRALDEGVAAHRRGEHTDAEDLANELLARS
jgi:hypothetical protein